MRDEHLNGQLFDTLFFAVMIPVSAILAERGRRNAMLGITGAIFLFGLILAPMFEAGTGGALGMMALGLALFVNAAILVLVACSVGLTELLSRIETRMGRR